MRAGTGLEGESKGYTVLEVMIFLAVSGFMFLIAASFISGKQASAEFRQGMAEMNSQLQQIINDVGNGFYPTSGNFPCSAPNVAGTQLIFTGTGAEQGAKQGCVFMGKVIQFGTNSSDQPDNTAYTVFTIAGRQYKSDPTSSAPQSFQEAQPAGVDQESMVEQKVLQWGARIYSMFTNDDPTQQVRGIGFFGSFDGGSLDPGSQTTLGLAIPNSTFGQTKQDTLADIKALSTSGVTPTASPNVTICFLGGNDHYGRITIGGNGQGLVTNMQISGKIPSGKCPEA